MDQVTQQNAAMVEQSTAASHSLAQQATELSALTGAFRMGRSNRGHAMRAELKKVAPHAFRKPAAASAPAPARAAPGKAPVRLAQPAPKARTVNSGAGNDRADWSEF